MLRLLLRRIFQLHIHLFLIFLLHIRFGIIYIQHKIKQMPCLNKYLRIFCLIIIMFYLWNSKALGSDEMAKRDSLRIEYQKAATDTAKIRILFKLGYRFLNGPSDSLIFYFRKALEIAEKKLQKYDETGIPENSEPVITYKKLAVRAFIEIGIEHFFQSNYPLALDNYFKGLKLSEEIDDVDLISECASEIGIVYKNQGKYEEALKFDNMALKYAEMGTDTSWIASCLVNNGSIYYQKGYYTIALKNYLKALKIFESLGHMRRIEACYLNIGKVYYEQNDLDKAMTYFRKALNIAVEENEKTGEAGCYMNIGAIFSDKEQYDSARYYLNRSIDLNRELGYKHGLDDCYSYIGFTYKKENRPDEAIESYRKALRISLEEQDSPGIAESLGNIAEIYYLQKQYSKALDKALQALEIAKETGNLPVMKNVYKVTSQIYEAMGNKAVALKYFKLYSNIKDSLFNDRKYRAIRELETKFETEKKEQQLELLKEKSRVQDLKITQRNRMILAFWIFFILSAAAIYLYFRNKRLKSKHKNIELEQKLLRSQMNPHFIFNSLIAIQSFIYNNDAILAGDYLAKFADLVRKILETSRIESITLEDEIKTIELYLQLQTLRFEGKFDYKIDVKNGLEPKNIKLPPMLAQPFIENAIEHGLRYKQDKGFLYIGFDKIGNHLKLTVEDNGIGREKAKEIEKARKHKSLAMAIIKERIDNLSKKFNERFFLKVEDLYDESGEAAGTRIVFEIPCL